MVPFRHSQPSPALPVPSPPGLAHHTSAPICVASLRISGSDPGSHLVPLDLANTHHLHTTSPCPPHPSAVPPSTLSRTSVLCSDVLYHAVPSHALVCHPTSLCLTPHHPRSTSTLQHCPSLASRSRPSPRLLRCTAMCPVSQQTTLALGKLLLAMQRGLRASVCFLRLCIHPLLFTLARAPLAHCTSLHLLIH